MERVLFFEANSDEHRNEPMREYPTGIVTFLFTDIEGSTRLLQRLGDAYRQVLEEHHGLIRAAISQAGGVEVSTAGDSFFAVFSTASQALATESPSASEAWSEEWAESSGAAESREAGRVKPQRR